MIKITVNIDVKNHEELIRENKGAFVSGIASMFGGSKYRVEEEVRKQVKQALQKSIKEHLVKHGVRADVLVE